MTEAVLEVVAFFGAMVGTAYTVGLLAHEHLHLLALRLCGRDGTVHYHLTSLRGEFSLTGVAAHVEPGVPWQRLSPRTMALVGLAPLALATVPLGLAVLWPTAWVGTLPPVQEAVVGGVVIGLLFSALPSIGGDTYIVKYAAGWRAVWPTRERRRRENHRAAEGIR